MPDMTQTTVAIVALIFGCVALLSLAMARSLGQRRRIQQRFSSISAAGSATEAEGDGLSRHLLWADSRLIGVDPNKHRDLRNDLVRAGFFSPQAVGTFVVAKRLLLFVLPCLGYLLLERLLPGADALATTVVLGLTIFIAYHLPAAFLKRSQRLLQDKYRVTFPEFLDMLVVCINAGMGLDAALGRVARELGPADAELRANLDLMAGEMRAGKSTVDAMKDFAERLGLPEARSLAMLLRQTIELGTDVGTALTVSADEIRDRRMMLAEEKAAALGPKLTLPLGAFIFPVVLIVVLTPAVLKILKATSG